ncbi:ABC transporter ATP-binding protein [Luteimicrobium xylanilyticum]|uniref:Aliphatic sulfonates import ATP-binding protein SsuB n=1 Tax=Luteimicrobium xylanilyticum TaxID=1133546 RepID=A0A5P9Q6H7_9MICO|nr:ABC transporter ATP-binding protein [Luteimicrobium xylanilyticum]QFU96710.1 Aliphatic sulfonates import ATP-binding protein SsuB [Luteimicrobium xylanilyticum]
MSGVERCPLLRVRDLAVRVRGVDGPEIVHGVDLDVQVGERVALVGESGSGKSTVAKALVRLDPGVEVAGSVQFDDAELVGAPERTLRAVRGAGISMIFQDPMAALNPVRRIVDQVAEPLLIRGVGRREAARRAVEMLDRLGVPRAAERARSYPTEFSGGMRQRVVMAAALVGGPQLLVADEPTTALDVRVQEQVLDLVVQQSDELGLAVLFITHDLGIVAGLADRVAVMRHGRIVEDGPVDRVFLEPQHPYTRGLIGAVPRIDADPGRRLATVADSLVVAREAPPPAGTNRSPADRTQLDGGRS